MKINGLNRKIACMENNPKNRARNLFQDSWLCDSVLRVSLCFQLIYLLKRKS